MRGWLVGALVVTACGGRALDDGSGSGGAGTAAGSSGRAGSPGAAGAPGFAGASPSAGAPSVGGFTGSAGGAGAAGSTTIGEACAAYCKSFLSGACANTLSSNCQTECTTELTNPPACQGPAMALMQCLAPIYEVGGGIDCQALQQAGEAVCRSQYNAYTTCEGSTIPEPESCSGGGSADGMSCSFDLKCDSGNFYSVSCKYAGTNQSTCFCSTSSSGGTFNLFESPATACNVAARACGFPSNTLPPGL